VSTLPVAVAAGHPETAAAGLEILAAGGSAADAASAMVLASCVSETVFTGLGGGGFAIHYCATTGEATCVDFFVSVPGLDGRMAPEPPRLIIDFNGQHVEYAHGPATVGVPGVPAGIERLHQRWGRMAWHDVVTPALDLATVGSSFSEAHSAVLGTVAPAMLLGAGAAAYAPTGRYLAGGEILMHPGLEHSLTLLRDEGSAPFYTGEIAEAITAALAEGGTLGPVDLEKYEVYESHPREVEFAGCRVLSRGDDLDDFLGTLASLDHLVTRPSDMGQFARNLVRAIRAEDRRGDTTNVAAADRDGNACVVTTSLGLASGVWLDGYGIHLNSMLGESELIRGSVAPGERLGSMMSPLVAVDDEGPRVVLGAAGGSRIRSAMIQVLTHVLADDRPLDKAIDAARFNPVPHAIHAEPGLPAVVVEALSDDNLLVRQAKDAYFGGVSGIDCRGPAADARRGGYAARLVN
jgi:gamma-glutamyltranspeptidase/glutathione hydrolase